jgi:hypothetical protein
LRDNGWKRIDSVELSKSCERYQDYPAVEREFTIARDHTFDPKRVGSAIAVVVIWPLVGL